VPFKLSRVLHAATVVAATATAALPDFDGLSTTTQAAAMAMQQQQQQLQQQQHKHSSNISGWQQHQ